MTDPQPKTIRLADYQVPGYLVDDVHLTFNLHSTRTIVTSRITFRANPDNANAEFFLHGENLELIWAKIDGQEITPELTAEGLTAQVPQEPFVWEAEVAINPAANTALEGLYISNGMFATQCEAEGFRKITYYPDRPDVMAPFTVRILTGRDIPMANGGNLDGERTQPVLLSNGNPVDQGADWAEWRDPWPKPAYLFALVAGDLVAHSDEFTTASGAHVDLNIWVRPGDEDRCAYAMDALKRSMVWDEQVYGREYDLGVFNIVAVDDFNMGAMENKGLNIFNSKFVLASPATATDLDYDFIEGIIAHEYFHNWTGNRITCRDWFQLCLKEGLTVYRDQQFSADMRGAAVRRIKDVLTLRARQFREDAGPLAHPVRPESYIEINNFYTATVYEKGAELIGMIRTLVGEDGYRAALDLYFDRHDGDAATIEDWLKVFEDATGRDLSQFALWYRQSGTPKLSVSEAYSDGTYSLTFSQETPPTPGQTDKKPLLIPVAVGLLNDAGDEIVPTKVLEFTEERQTFTFDDLSSKPIPSILRGFSAPVILNRASTPAERAFLLANDTDPFNKFEAGRLLAKDVLVDMVVSGSTPSTDFLDALKRVTFDDSLEPSFRALVLSLPSPDDMAQTLFDSGATPDPLAIYIARRALWSALANTASDGISELYNALSVPGPYSPDAKAAGQRSLRQTALSLLSRLDEGQAAKAQFARAGNMTEQVGALSVLLDLGKGQDEAAQFYDQWRADRLVIDKWFSLQIAQSAPGDTVETAQKLTEHGDFEWKNPNRFRSVLGALTGNAAGFHHPSGAAYRFLADWLIRLDPINPQTTARMCSAFETWRRYDRDRQEMIQEQLERIAATPNLSRDVAEMTGRILDA